MVGFYNWILKCEAPGVRTFHADHGFGNWKTFSMSPTTRGWMQSDLVFHDLWRKSVTWFLMEGIHAELAWQLDSAGWKMASLKENCILRSVRDAFLTLRHAYPSLPPQCRRQRALVTSQLPCSLLLSCLARSSWWLCEVIPLYGYKTGALEGACDYHSQSQDAPRTPQVVFQVPYLSRVCSFLLSSAGKGRMGAPDEQTTNVCWYQGSKYILVSLKLGKEKLVTSWQGPVP